MRCGAPLPPRDTALDTEGAEPRASSGERRLHVGLGVFLLTLAATLALSAVLMFVLGLPVLVVGAVLPLLWFGVRPRR